MLYKVNGNEFQLIVGDLHYEKQYYCADSFFPRIHL